MKLLIILVTFVRCQALTPFAVPEDPFDSIPIENSVPINVYFNGAEDMSHLASSSKDSNYTHVPSAAESSSTESTIFPTSTVNSSLEVILSRNISDAFEYQNSSLGDSFLNNENVSEDSLFSSESRTTVSVVGTTNNMSFYSSDKNLPSIADDSLPGSYGSSDSSNALSTIGNNSVLKYDIDADLYYSDVFLPALGLSPNSLLNSTNDYSNFSKKIEDSDDLGLDNFTLILEKSNFTDDYILPNKSYDREARLTDGNDTILITKIESYTNIARVTDPMQINNVFSTLNISYVYSPLNVSNIFSPTNISKVYSPVYIKGVNSPLRISDIYSPIQIVNVYSPIILTNVYSPVNLSNVHSSINATQVYSLINIDDYTRKTKVSEVHNSLNSSSGKESSSTSTTFTSTSAGVPRDSTQDQNSGMTLGPTDTSNATTPFEFDLPNTTVSYFDYEDLFTSDVIPNRTNTTFSNKPSIIVNISDANSPLSDYSPSSFTNSSLFDEIVDIYGNESVNTSVPYNTSNIPYPYGMTNKSSTPYDNSNASFSNNDTNAFFPNDDINMSYSGSDNISYPYGASNMSSYNDTNISYPYRDTNTSSPHDNSNVSYPYGDINMSYPYDGTNISSYDSTNISSPYNDTNLSYPHDLKNDNTNSTEDIGNTTFSDPYDITHISYPYDFENCSDPYGSNMKNTYPCNTTWFDPTNIPDVADSANTSNGDHSHRCSGGDVLQHIFFTYSLPSTTPTYQGVDYSNQLPGTVPRGTYLNEDRHLLESLGGHHDFVADQNIFQSRDTKKIVPLGSHEETSFEPEPYHLFEVPYNSRQNSRGPLSYPLDYKDLHALDVYDIADLYGIPQVFH
ncbi:hypothetical protein SK128_018046 [Halocaridina rubra]|uniref:Uncharacterized protein n=1 Tax=Halocaridina rubra TaxID=373956 RepID=A0AAN8X386_HALRR